MMSKVEAARAAVERLANVQMNISLAEWSEISATILAALTHPAPAVESAQVADMAMLIRMLVRNMPPGLKIRDTAVDYLKRHRLQGSPLRASLATDAEG